jgi:hypothetical protein
MYLAKKCDTEVRLSAGWNKSGYSLRQMGHADRANLSGIAPDGTKAIQPTFAEDFMLEHSLSRAQATWIGIAGSSGPMPRKAQQSAQSCGFPS